ncbi:MAG TPA: PKD domain-containing protein, partial [Miltoncostaeaceae bacterium]|nr:PKD domain-containing protein [Miltoncostaeaceae bacterium]
MIRTTYRRTAVARLALRLAVAVAVLSCAAPAMAAAGDGAFTTVASGLGQPRGIAVESSGSRLVVDLTSDRLWRISPSGVKTTVAGGGAPGFSGDGGPATSAQLDYPTDVITIGSGPYQGILIADEYNQRIRRIDPSGVISTVAGDGVAGFAGDGGAATSAHLRNPRALSATGDGGFLIADELNHRIRQVSPSGTITTVAGTGTAGYAGDGGSPTSAKLRRPLGVEWVAIGRFLIADGYNDCIREVSGGTIRTIAGRCGEPGFGGDGGAATSALLSRPRDIVRSPDGGIYFPDSLNHRIRRIAPDGVISTVAGTGTAGNTTGPALESNLREPSNVLLEPSGDLLVADTNNGLLRKLQQPLPTISSLAPARASADGTPITLTVNGSGFTSSAVVLWQGSPRPTTRVSSTRLTAVISGSDVAAEGTASISVRAGLGGGDESATAAFTIGAPSGGGGSGGGGGAVIPAGNLTANPSFESDANKWSCFHCTLTRSAAADSPNGNQIAVITMGSGWTSMALDDSPDTIGATTAGAGYSAQAYVRAANPAAVGRTVRLFLREKNSAGTVVKDTGGPTATLTNTFTPITVSATGQSTGNKMDLRVSLSSGNAGDAIAIDAVTLLAGGGSTPPVGGPTNQPPTATFTVSDSPIEDQPVTFTDTSTDPEGGSLARGWDTDNDGQFDDGNGATATATFADPGTYTVRLQVTDPAAASAVATKQVTVAATPSSGGGAVIPAGNLTANPSFE